MASDLSFLPAVAGAVAALVATSFLLGSARAHARVEGDIAIVEYGLPMKFFVGVGWLCVLAFAVVAALEPSQSVLAWSVTGAVFALVLPMHLEFFYLQIRYDAHGVQTSSPWRPSRSIPWEAFTDVTFSRLAMWYVAHTRAKGSVRLHVYLSGLQSILSEFQRRGLSIPKVVGRPQP